MDKRAVVLSLAVIAAATPSRPPASAHGLSSTQQANAIKSTDESSSWHHCSLQETAGLRGAPTIAAGKDARLRKQMSTPLLLRKLPWEDRSLALSPLAGWCIQTSNIKHQLLLRDCHENFGKNAESASSEKPEKLCSLVN